MIIRPAREGDADAVIELGKRMHEESAYAFLPYDLKKVRALFNSYIADPEKQCGLVAEEDSKLIGMFGGYLTSYFFCNEKIACDLIFFVDEKHRGSSAAPRLIRAFRQWASVHGASEICLGVSTQINTERTGKFYERMGLQHVGGVYKQRLN